MLNEIRLMPAAGAALAILYLCTGCDGGDDADGPENTSGVHVVGTDDDQDLPPDESGVGMDEAEAGGTIGRGTAEDASSPGTGEIIPDGMQCITFRGWRMLVPAAWQREAPASSMRDIQMRVPSELLDQPDAGFVVYGGIGGTVQQNIDRWTQQFMSGDGSEVRPLVENFRAGDLQIAVVELSGTYTSSMMPEESGSDVTMIQAIVETPAGEQIFIRLLGPNEVVAANKAALRSALEGLAPAR